MIKSLLTEKGDLNLRNIYYYIHIYVYIQMYLSETRSSWVRE